MEAQGRGDSIPVTASKQQQMRDLALCSRSRPSVRTVRTGGRKRFGSSLLRDSLRERAKKKRSPFAILIFSNWNRSIAGGSGPQTPLGDRPGPPLSPSLVLGALYEAVPLLPLPLRLILVVSNGKTTRIKGLILQGSVFFFTFFSKSLLSDLSRAACLGMSKLATLVWNY